MDLNKLFEIFAEKKLHYIEVRTNDNGYFRAFASTGYNGRGIAVEISITDVRSEIQTEIEVRLMSRKVEAVEEKVYAEDRAFELIKNFDTNDK
jgi:adenine-specific DNA methylase